MVHPGTEERHRFLLETSVCLLEDALALLRETSDSQFSRSPAGLPGQRIGSHLRHVIEFYECFLEGRRAARIDYDARQRETELEVNRTAAIARLQSLIERLPGEVPLKDSTLFVRVEDAAGADLRHQYMVSSVGRELQALSSHTVHHYGMIAVIARLLGVRVADHFGFASSTLRYRATLLGEAA
jgi:hypothetical protein